MARVYVDPQLKHLVKEIPDGDKIEELPTEELQRKFSDVQGQEIIPFFGAGASLPTKPPEQELPVSRRPTDVQLNAICSDFAISDPTARLLIEVALQLAQLLDARARFPGIKTPASADYEIAPSSWELANDLSEKLNLKPYQPYVDRLSELLKEPSPNQAYLPLVKSISAFMGIHHSIPQLLTTASYYAASGGEEKRFNLLKFLLARFKNVKTATYIQQKFAEHAAAYIEARNRQGLKKRDYLVITTNYDNLLEQQLLEAGVPTCVVTVKAAITNAPQISVYFPPENRKLVGNDAFDALNREYNPVKRVMPKDYQPQNKSHNLVMIYKLHGRPEQIYDTVDNVIIADRDYVDFIERNAETKLIPAIVLNRLSESRLLFLGYSFSDWNIRALYEQVIRWRIKTGKYGGETDYVVMKSYNKADHLFFNRWNDLSVLIADLNTIAPVFVKPQ
jgi:hypothetical protein